MLGSKLMKTYFVNVKVLVLLFVLPSYLYGRFVLIKEIQFRDDAQLRHKVAVIEIAWNAFHFLWVKSEINVVHWTLNVVIRQFQSKRKMQGKIYPPGIGAANLYSNNNVKVVTGKRNGVRTNKTHF